jgi:hypothetical protein
MTEESDTADRRDRRPSIEERVARREMVDAEGRDRYDTLLRHLRAGQEITLESRRRERLDWHPIANKLVVAALVVVAVYFVVSTAVSIWREQRVDTWTGPDATVTSGQKLEGCPSFIKLDDPVFPAWIRFRGGLFQRSEQAVPIGATNIGSTYLDTGYTHDDLRIFSVEAPGLGPIGTRIAVLNAGAPAGQVYRLVQGCT